MPQIRPELLRGMAVLGLFVAMIVVTSHFMPYTVTPSGYTRVGIQTLADDPVPLEGYNVSSSTVVIDSVDHGSYHLMGTEEGVHLLFPATLGGPAVGELVLFRGTSWVLANGTVSVHEFYVLDESSSIIRSIPGIILFVVLFFAVFAIDLERLAFVPRGERHA